MTATTFQSLVAGLPHAHCANLACILEIESEDTSAICERVRWLYHSKVRAGLRAQGSALANTVLSKTTGKRARFARRPATRRPVIRSAASFHSRGQRPWHNRLSVLIEPDGKVVKHWHRVAKAADHPQKVLKALQQA